MNDSLRQQYLKEIGIQSWYLKSALEDKFIEPEITQELQLNKELQPNKEPQLYKEPQQYNEPQLEFIEPEEVVTTESKAVPVNMDADSEELNSSIIVTANKVVDNFSADIKLPETKENVNETTVNTRADSELNHKINLCKKCPSRDSRMNVLIGQGNSEASVFIIGGAPNAEEDRLGTYFVEQSKTLFQAMLNCVDLQHDYFYTGLIKCYSMEDFRFSEQDKLNCIPYLYAQIDQINPSVLFVLGAAEAQALLDTKQSFNELRGKVHHVSINEKDYSVIVSYHPAYLLRNPLYKKESLKDLIMVKNLLK